METEVMRKELRDVIDSGDEWLLQKIYEVVKEYNDIPEERMRLIMQERENYLNGKGKSYTWEEAKVIVRSKKKTP